MIDFGILILIRRFWSFKSGGETFETEYLQGVFCNMVCQMHEAWSNNVNIGEVLQLGEVIACRPIGVCVP